jgi:RHS repeat-associated protein
MQSSVSERLTGFEVSTGETLAIFELSRKELDEETGFYYYGARYLNPKTSMWISADPAMGEYVPRAPADDEARKHKENLPGMGGVYNYVNFHVYHYAGNNPVKYIDPDGEKLKNVTSRATQNTPGTAQLPLGDNKSTNAFGRWGCFFTAVMNIANTIQMDKYDDTNNNGSISDFSDDTKYFLPDLNTGFTENLYVGGVNSLLHDVTGDYYAVDKYRKGAKNDPVEALNFFNNSTNDYFVIADVGGHFVNVLGIGEADTLLVHDTYDRTRNYSGANKTPTTKEYKLEDIRSIYVIKLLGSAYE